MQFTSSDGVGHDDRLTKLARGLSANTTVVKAVVPLPEGHLALNFKTSLANAKTTRTPLLRDVLAASVPLLHEMDEDRRQALQSFLQVDSRVPPGTGGTAGDLMGLLAEKLSSDVRDGEDEMTYGTAPSYDEEVGYFTEVYEEAPIHDDEEP